MVSTVHWMALETAGGADRVLDIIIYCLTEQSRFTIISGTVVYIVTVRQVVKHWTLNTCMAT
jgi:hypothetical protein